MIWPSFVVLVVMWAVGLRGSAVAALAPSSRMLVRGAGPMGSSLLAFAPLNTVRALRTTPVYAEKNRTDTPPPTPASSSATPGKDSEASRAALWDQMLNTIVVDPVDTSADAQRKSRDVFGANLDAWSSGPSSNAQATSVMDQLEDEFRSRPTIGPAAPATPTTGRSVSASNSFGNNSVSMLYRNLMGTLRRNNVRRELKLQERYEKPNQKRRRIRSERHRRRFADMVRRKVQLVRTHLLIQIMALKARGA